LIGVDEFGDVVFVEARIGVLDELDGEGVDTLRARM